MLINSLLFSIVDGLDGHYLELLNSNVSISIQSETFELIENWNYFKQDIKSKNHFFIKNPAELEAIEEILSVRQYSKGKIFSCSRISK